jgi:hypothetical protein
MTMQSEDQYMERTPDLVARIRAMRKAAEKQMNRFTRTADYDVRRFVGRMPKPQPDSNETALPSSGKSRPKRSAATTQTSIEFSTVPTKHRDDGDAA